MLIAGPIPVGNVQVISGTFGKQQGRKQYLVIPSIIEKKLKVNSMFSSIHK